MLVVARTANRSATATRSRVAHQDYHEYIAGARGVELSGLGCTLEEWDAVAATMPPSVRPSGRGDWSPAFETAWRKFQQKAAAAKPRRDNSLVMRMTEIRRVLLDGRMRSVDEIAIAVSRTTERVRLTLGEMRQRGEVKCHDVPDAGIRGNPQRFFLTNEAALPAALGPHTRERRPGGNAQGSASC